MAWEVEPQTQKASQHRNLPMVDRRSVLGSVTYRVAGVVVGSLPRFQREVASLLVYGSQCPAEEGGCDVCPDRPPLGFCSSSSRVLSHF